MTPEQKIDVSTALLAYWTSRDEAAAAQAAKGVVDVGGRAGVTSGGHLDRVAQLLGRICIAAGAPASQVYYKAPADDPLKRTGSAVGFTLPGWFRPTKQWDLVVHHGDGANRMPIAIVELKSQNGPSFGNNANNRAEEAIGNALDLARAKSEGLIPGDPWTGYAFVIEDDANSRLARGKNDRGMYPRAPLFADWSYISRVQHLCQRLLDEGLYDAAWAVTTSRPPAFSWHELDENVSGYVRFITGLTAAIEKYYPDGRKGGDPTISLF